MGKLAKCQRFLVLAPCLAVSCFLGFGLFSFLVVTVSILILSITFLVTISKKQKQSLAIDEKLHPDENPTCDSTRNFLENEGKEKLEFQAARESDAGSVNEPGDFPSDSESIDDDDDDGDSVSSESFELDWLRCDNNVVQNGVVSSTDSVSEDDDDDDDDDESLIEISIPGTCISTLVTDEEEEQQTKAQKFLSNDLPDDFMPESLMRQQCLLELIPDSHEVNEEDNLIEIDISMGSIKMFKA